MFLGGLPEPATDSGRCWHRFLELSDPEYFHNVLITVHPIKPKNVITGFWKRYLCTTGPLSPKQMRCITLTKKEHHLKTAWATRSLVDATVLMMKTSYDKFPTLEKFILVDGKSCPLYNLSVIYENVTANCNNWLDPLNNSCANFEHNSQLFCGRDICMKRADCSFWSQWSILDVRYFHSLLNTNIQKDPDDIECNNSTVNQIIVPDVNDHDAEIVNQSLVELLDANSKPCNFSDELYFGFYLKRGRTVDEFLNIIQTISPRDLIREYEVIKPVCTNVEYIAPVLIEPHNNYKNGIYILDADRSRRYPYYLSHIRFDDKTISKRLYTIPPIYTDWRYFNPNPMNIFRSFNHPNFNIKEYLNAHSQDAIAQLSKLDNDGSSLTFTGLGMFRVPYWAHPLEYNTTKLSSFVNAYNFFEYAKHLNPNDYYFNYLRRVYHKIIADFNAVEFEKVGENNFAVLRPSDDEKVGKYISAETLNSARMRGCLFIRKCEEGSLIDHYADQLYTHPKTNQGSLPYKVLDNQCPERNEKNIERSIADLDGYEKSALIQLAKYFDISPRLKRDKLLPTIAKKILSNS